MFSIFKKKVGKQFEIGDRVVVSKDGGWKDNYTGKVVGLAGDNGLQKTRLGLVYMYWIKFDGDAFDIDNDGPYLESEVLSIYLSNVI
jgi:hypothetical protein